MTRQTILLCFGGRSSEHDISLMSARNVYAAMDGERYDVRLAYIDRQGKWWLFDDWLDNFDSHKTTQLAAVPGAKSLLLLPGNAVLRVDVLFPVLHGRYGEDGTIQGFAEMLGVPFVGPSVLGAALTMDKVRTKRMAEACGIAVVPWRVWLKDEEAPSYEECRRQLGGVLFVKPVASGSSVGVSRVTNEQEWHEACELARQYDSTVLIEKAINPREIEVAVLGTTRPRVSIPGEIISEELFYDFDDKYDSNTTSVLSIPADISSEFSDQVRDIARRVYGAVAGRGLARVDFFIDKDSGEVYFNEINSIPGFTNISMYPKLWQHEGVTYSELITELIRLAHE